MPGLRPGNPLKIVRILDGFIIIVKRATGIAAVWISYDLILFHFLTSVIAFFRKKCYTMKKGGLEDV